MGALLLPTTVVGSHAYPSWFWTAMQEIEQGRYGTTDASETFDDAVNIAIFDQEHAGGFCRKFSFGRPLEYDLPLR